MAFNIRLDRIFPGLGVPLRNDPVFLQSAIALSGTAQVSTPIPAASIGTLSLTTTAGKIRIKIYNGGGTTPALTDLVVTATDGTNTITIPQSILHPTVAIGITTTGWFDFEFEYLVDTGNPSGGSVGQLSSLVGGINKFNVLTTFSGTAPTASMDLELAPLI